MDEYNGLKKII